MSSHSTQKNSAAQSSPAKLIFAIIFGAIVIAGAIVYVGSIGSSGATASVDNVSVVDGKQVIEVTARGGYTPQLTRAKAGIPTILRMKTENAFDCSIALRLPTLNIAKNLPPLGTTDIEIPPQQAGTTIPAMCAMGMYRFQVQFE